MRVPPHRLWDVEHWADIAEELLKSVGYNATPVTMKTMDRGALPSGIEIARAKVTDVLLGHDFYEVLTDGFHGKALDERLHVGAGHPLAAHVTILNADKAKNVIVIKRGQGAGFSGIENGLFFLDNTRMLYGDGQKAVAELVNAIKAAG